MWVHAKVNRIDVLLAYCINKARSEFGRVVKAEFAVDSWLFTNDYWHFFFKQAVDEQIALLRLSKLVLKNYLNFYFAYLPTQCEPIFGPRNINSSWRGLIDDANPLVQILIEHIIIFMLN